MGAGTAGGRELSGEPDDAIGVEDRETGGSGAEVENRGVSSPFPTPVPLLWSSPGVGIVWSARGGPG